MSCASFNVPGNSPTSPCAYSGSANIDMLLDESLKDGCNISAVLAATEIWYCSKRGSPLSLFSDANEISLYMPSGEIIILRAPCKEDAIGDQRRFEINTAFAFFFFGCRSSDRKYCLMREVSSIR